MKDNSNLYKEIWRGGDIVIFLNVKRAGLRLEDERTGEYIEADSFKDLRQRLMNIHDMTSSSLFEILNHKNEIMRRVVYEVRDE